MKNLQYEKKIAKKCIIQAQWQNIFTMFLFLALELMKNNISLLPTRELETNGGKDEFAGDH